MGSTRSDTDNRIKRKESPPCVWGVQRLHVVNTLCRGITPMCMGNTVVPLIGYVSSLESPP